MRRCDRLTPESTEDTEESSPTHFFSCDWGTTSFRLRLVALEGQRVVDELREDAGVKSIQSTLGDQATPAQRAAAFGVFLQERVRRMAAGQGMDPSGLATVVSGMASSTVGWHELPYARAPLALDGRNLVVAPVPTESWDPRLGPVWLVSGVRTATDIMRGEECEILGLLDPRGLGALGMPDAGVMILPGTHSKHAWFRAGALVDFRTVMTGELADVLARHSLLRVSVAWPPVGALDAESTRAVFVEAVRLAAQNGLGASLFRVRTRAVLDGAPAGDNAWFLSGLLIGAEVAGLVSALRADPDSPALILAGAAQFTALYELALRTLDAGGRWRVLTPAEVAGATIRAHAAILRRQTTAPAERTA